jgi:hypothetical protein
MSNNIDALCKTLENLPSDVKLELAKRLNSDVISQLSAAETEKAEKVRVARIQTMRAERDPQFRLVEGVLARAGIKIEEASSVAALDRLFANAARQASVEDRLFAKSALHRLGLMAA